MSEISVELSALDRLREKKSPELKIKEEDLLQLNSELIWELELPERCVRLDYKTRFPLTDEDGNIAKKDLFRVNHSESQLKTGEIYFPVLDHDMLLPYSLEIEGIKSVTIYQAYNNYVNYEVYYRRGDIMKIVAYKGKKVLNPNEEKHLKKLPFEEYVVLIRFDKERNQWVFLQDEEVFNNLKNEIEELRKTKEIMELTKAYFKYRNQYTTYLNENRLDFTEVIKYIKGLLKTTKEYHEIQNILCEITDTNYEFVKSQIESVEEYFNEAIIRLESDELNEVSKGNVVTNLKTKLNGLLTVEGYWIEDEQTYPNIARIYNLRQKSKENRTPDSKRKLDQNLVSHFRKHGKNYVEINDVGFKSFVKNEGKK